MHSLMSITHGRGHWAPRMKRSGRRGSTKRLKSYPSWTRPSNHHSTSRTPRKGLGGAAESTHRIATQSGRLADRAPGELEPRFHKESTRGRSPKTLRFNQVENSP